jgi:HSP20 family protein
MAKGKAKEKEVVPYKPGWMPSIFDEMDRLFERFFGRRFGPVWWPSIKWPEELDITYPSVDIFEDKDTVVVKAELPGAKKEDLSVNITDNTITISGEKKKEEKIDRKDYYRLERSYGSFSRSFTLPAEVQSSKAKAKFTNGVLEIRIPKTEEAKKKGKKVKIE